MTTSVQRLAYTDPTEHARRLSAIRRAATRGWSGAETARALGIKRSTLYSWADYYQIDIPWRAGRNLRVRARVAVEARQQLADQINALLDHGQTVPCEGSPLPTSDRPEDREQAARDLCPHCPVRAACDAAGRSEHFGIWGGIDRTVRTYPTEGKTP